jgi:hypothetical protein
MENSSETGLSPLTGNPYEDDTPTVQSRLFRFMLHGCVATFGSSVIGFILLVSLLDAGSAQRQGLLLTLATSQYSPAFWATGFFLGLVINNQLKDRSALWVGPLCLLLFSALVLQEVWFLSHSTYFRALTQGHYWHYEYDQYFSLNDGGCGNTECMGKLLLPSVVSSVAYSAGAWLALRYTKKTSAASMTKG